MSAEFNRNGVVLYRGPSAIDGSPIIVIATGLKASSANTKTGAMVQTWILAADVNPLEALRTGADVGICGGCIHRPTSFDGATWKDRSCYVNVAQAPLNVWKTAGRGRYSDQWDAESFRGRYVRLGSYGDPAAVPVSVWRTVLELATGWTGYTHQARNPKLRGVLEWCQVSADSEADAVAARAAGCGSFRVLAADEKPAEFETVCPASEEAGRKATCETCGMCSGRTGAAIAINAHGIGAASHRATNRRPLSLPVLS
jgi:hypothetical protein